MTRRIVQQHIGTMAGEPVTTFVFKEGVEIRFVVSMPQRESFAAEIENWLHGDGSGVARLCRRIEEPLLNAEFAVGARAPSSKAFDQERFFRFHPVYA